MSLDAIHARQGGQETEAPGLAIVTADDREPAPRPRPRDLKFDREQCETLLSYVSSINELRILHADRKNGYFVTTEYPVTQSGFFDDASALIAEAGACKGVNAYITFNPLKRDVMALVANKAIRAKKGGSASDDDVECIRFFLLDIDSKRRTGISATDAELRAALDLKAAVFERFPEFRRCAISGNSGNGAYILVRVDDLPNDEATHALLKRVNESLGAIFNNDAAEIDVKTTNASRVMCLAGTVKCKGENRPDRPHRPVTIDDEPGRTLIPFDPVAWLAENEVEPPATKPAFLPSPVAPRNGSSAGQGWTPRRVANYIARAIEGEMENADTPEKRNNALNSAAFKLARRLHTGIISEDQIRQAIGPIAAVNGLPPAEIQATLDSAIRGGRKKPKDLPPANDYEPRNGHATHGPAPSPSTANRRRLPPGTPIHARDQDNYGHVVEDTGGESIRCRFVSPGGREATPLIPAKFIDVNGAPLVAPDTPPIDLGILEIRPFMAARHLREWLIPNVLVKNKAAILGGAQKTLKTSLAVDLAVSVAGALPFLGCEDFRPPQPRRTLLISGESGESVIQETIRRVCKAREIDYHELAGQLFVGFTLPQLSNPEELATLAAFVAENRVELVIIDPLYLCLMGSGTAIDPKNLFSVGPVLKTVCDTCLKAGATPILVHHFRKNREQPYGKPEMEDLAFSGITEFARQWLLLSRSERYEPGSGLHRLWFSVGGSDGHSGEWALKVDEGITHEDFRDRQWSVELSRAADASAEEREAKAARRIEQQDAKAAQRAADAMQRVLDALDRNPVGLSKNNLRAATSLTHDALGQALYLLENDRFLIESVEIPVATRGKAAGKGGRTVTGFRRTNNPDNPGDNPGDNPESGLSETKNE